MTAPTSLPDFPVTAHTTLLPVRFEPPLQNPAPGGLYTNVVWTDVAAEEASRHLTGVEVRPVGNFGGAASSGVWDAPWCTPPQLEGSRKEGARAEGLDPFDPTVVWAFDFCDLTEPSRAEVEARAAQTLRMRESLMVARQFADRLLTDAVPEVVDDVVTALSHLEGEFAEANAVGFVHLSPEWLPVLVAEHLVTKSGAKWLTPAGHTLILDGGYRAGLGATMVATSAPLLGWRDAAQVRTAMDERHNVYAAVAERSVLVGYEAAIGAATVTP
jgi:hypothetical protein